MKIHFTGKNVSVTEALESYATKKLQKLLTHFPSITRINVVFHIENLVHTAEATIHVTHSDVHAACDEDDLYKAIDGLYDKLDRQLHTLKEKRQDHRE